MPSQVLEPPLMPSQVPEPPPLMPSQAPQPPPIPSQVLEPPPPLMLLQVPAPPLIPSPCPHPPLEAEPLLVLPLAALVALPRLPLALPPLHPQAQAAPATFHLRGRAVVAPQASLPLPATHHLLPVPALPLPLHWPGLSLPASLLAHRRQFLLPLRLLHPQRPQRRLCHSMLHMLQQAELHQLPHWGQSPTGCSPRCSTHPSLQWLPALPPAAVHLHRFANCPIGSTRRSQLRRLQPKRPISAHLNQQSPGASLELPGSSPSALP
mmetsp:Transcript_19844/g.46137  ORF Transcript_19844/g.46137 Transcript_19844/m.46137 type:complete len:265 (+) Transcript_19844:428-1222(+)